MRVWLSTIRQRALTAYARSLGITPGWYANNCHCSDHSKICSTSDLCYRGDVAATLAYGFASLKVDGCGAQKNFSEYAPLFNASGTRVLLENCHEGRPKRESDGTLNCPMHLFRTSADIRPTYGCAAWLRICLRRGQQLVACMDSWHVVCLWRGVSAHHKQAFSHHIVHGSHRVRRTSILNLHNLHDLHDDAGL